MKSFAWFATVAITAIAAVAIAKRLPVVSGLIS
jgi:hypothetical protein